MPYMRISAFAHVTGARLYCYTDRTTLYIKRLQENSGAHNSKEMINAILEYNYYFLLHLGT